MKNKIHTLISTTASILAISSIATLSTSVQATDTWKTLPASTCQVYNLGHTVPEQVLYQSEYVTHKDVGGGPSSTSVYCPIKMDDNAPATVGVYVDYSKVDSLGCTLYTNHFYGLPKVSHNYSMSSGLKKYTYKTINTGNWWSVQVRCQLGDGDKIHALNYKAL